MSSDRKDLASGNDEGFLARWSRMKRTEARESSPQQTGTPPAQETTEPVDLSKLPKLEDLTETSDIAQFLQKGVPEELRRLALRKAWALDPAIRDFIEVAENQYNFNDPDGVPGFGPLPPGTDIAALLRQAIGEIPLSPAIPPEGGDDLEGTEKRPNVPSSELEPIASDESSTAREPTAIAFALARELPASPSEGASVEQELTAAHQRTRRRHGGAMPGE